MVQPVTPGVRCPKKNDDFTAFLITQLNYSANFTLESYDVLPILPQFTGRLKNSRTMIWKL